MYMNAYHKEQGEVRMFEVDARSAIARFPKEWSNEPWPAESEDGVSSASKRGRPRQPEEKLPKDGSDEPNTEGESDIRSE